MIPGLLAWTNEQRAIVDRHLKNLEHEYESENARCEAKELLEKIRSHNELIAAGARDYIERERGRRLTSE